MIDRPPVRFSRHNYQYEQSGIYDPSRWPTMKDFWFDEEYQVERYIKSIENKISWVKVPVFWPNLGPNVFAGFYGCELKFGEVTSWAEHILDDLNDPVELDWENKYLKKLDSLTKLALEMNENRLSGGYSDLHPAWTGWEPFATGKKCSWTCTITLNGWKTARPVLR